MLKRLITGIFILLTVATFIVLKQFNSLIFDALIMIIMYGSLYETIKVYKTDGKNIDYSVFLTPALMCVIFNLEKNTFRAYGFVVLMTVIFILFLLTSEIIGYGIKRKNGTTETDPDVLNRTLFDKTKYTLQVYAYPICVLSTLLALNHLEYNLSYMGLILSFACSMSTDSFAYLFGKCFGKRKFIPEVSPNKTIAGMFGGFFGGIVASIVCILCFVYFPAFKDTVCANKDMFVLVFAVLGVLGALADQLGDLIASALKRKVGVKDYGHIFPGHGGFMDRVDGLMFTFATVYITFALFLI